MHDMKCSEVIKSTMNLKMESDSLESRFSILCFVGHGTYHIIHSNYLPLVILKCCNRNNDKMIDSS